MTSIIQPLENGLGLEDMAVATFITLFQSLNANLAAIEAERAPRDEFLAELRGIDYEPVTLEQIEDEHFYLGHVPSLILDETPITNYPACAVMAYQASPESFDAQEDQLSAFRDRLYVEVMVKASPIEGEEVCDRRVWRTADAVNRTITADQTLGGSTFGIGGAATAIISEVMTRPVSDSDDTDYFWQAARIEYGVTKFSPFT